MNTTWIDSNVLCPYYCGVVKNTITCEGLYGHVDDFPTDHIKISLGNKKLLTKHMTQYCCNRYMTCPIYTVIATKYE